MFCFVGDFPKVPPKFKGTISVIIGYEHHPSRVNPLIKCLSSLRDYDQLCIVETGVTRYLTRKFIRKVVPQEVDYKYLKVFSATPYNRAWNFNIGVRHLATSDIVVLMDADLVLPPDYFSVLRECVLSPDWVGVGWNELVYLSSKATEKTLELPGSEILIPEGEETRAITPSKSGAAGGIFISFRETYMKFDGMDERFYGRTAEDNAHWAKLEALGYPVKTLPVKVHHLYHEMNKLIAPNRELVFEMLGWSKQKWLEEIKINWGSINGYSIRSD